MSQKWKDTDYSKTIAKIRVFEKNMLKRHQLEKMTELSRMEDAYKMLADAGWHFSYEEKDPRAVLSEQQQWLFTFLRETIPEEHFLKLMLVKIDYQNIKAFLKQELSGGQIRPELFAEGGTVPVSALVKSLSEREQGQLSPRMFRAFAEARETFLKNRNPQQIDLLLDEACMEETVSLAEAFGNAFLLDYLRAQIDVVNLKTVLRIRKVTDEPGQLGHLFLEGGRVETAKWTAWLPLSREELKAFVLDTWMGKRLEKELEAYFSDGAMTELEKGFDNLMLEKLRPARFIMFGPEPIFVYAKYMENEVRAVRIILNGILSGLSPQSIKERLRFGYA